MKHMQSETCNLKSAISPTAIRPVAQLAEHRSPKPGVGGSIPSWPATDGRDSRLLFVVRAGQPRAGERATINAQRARESNGSQLADNDARHDERGDGWPH